MSTKAGMRTFRLIPLVLAVFCGYLHTVINRRFDEIGDLVSHNGSYLSVLDGPNAKGFTGFGGEQYSGAAVVDKTDGLVPRRINMTLLQGPAVDLKEKTLDRFEWIVPNEDRVLANSAEYQERLLQYTMDMLPNHLDPSASKGNEGSKAENEEDDLNRPQPYQYREIDIIVPASGQDSRLSLFAERLGVAIKNFLTWYDNERRPAILRRIRQEEMEEVGVDQNDQVRSEPDLDLKFRFHVTRYPLDVQKTEDDFEALVTELSEKTTLPREQINLVRVGQDADDSQQFPITFNRAHARNVLHQNACREDYCIVTAFDVDMQVLPIFFHRALQSVTPHVKAYFPIVFSEFNPETVQRVQDFLCSPDNKPLNREDRLLPPFSSHRGLWRDFGYGMYVLAGSDAQRFRFNEDHQGWGHEDNDFYKLVHNKMRVDRRHEYGLIHSWHTKNCAPGVDLKTKDQWIDCLNSRDVLEGSTLGLLLRPALKTYRAQDFPGVKRTNTQSDTVPTNDLVQTKDVKLDSKDEVLKRKIDDDNNEKVKDDKKEGEDLGKEPGESDAGESPNKEVVEDNQTSKMTDETSSGKENLGENSAPENAVEEPAFANPSDEDAAKERKNQDDEPGALQRRRRLEERRRDPAESQ